MKVFQALHTYKPYLNYFEDRYDVSELSFEEHRKVLIQDRFYAAHILKPCLDMTKDGFYTLWDYAGLQLKWAKERGWGETDLKKILLAQLEEFKPDVFYCFSPPLILAEDLESISDSVIKICWSAAPGIDSSYFKPYTTRLTNLPIDVLPKEIAGFRSDLFQPAFDPIMEDFSKNTERPIDLFFYGQYSTAFLERNKHIDTLVEFKKKSNLNIEIALQYNVKTIPYPKRILNRFMTKTIPGQSVQDNTIDPLYGIELYEKISKSKLVFNAGVDFSKNHKVNMRNFEVLGCGAHMISDKGIYPNHFVPGKHFSTYDSIKDCINKVKSLVGNDTFRIEVANEGNEMIKKNFSKDVQWSEFKRIVSTL
jgi:hypothetical protein